MRQKGIAGTLPISAVIASFNEGHILEDCLKSVQFCDEVIVVNLNSNDNTEEIALRYCDKYYFEDKDLLYFDAYHDKYIPNIENDWFLLMDPDERISGALIESIKLTLINVADDVSVIRVPMFNYFKGKKLKGTVYGGVIYARLLYRLSGVHVGNEVHSSIKMKDGYTRIKIKFEGENYSRHYWCSSWSQLLSKHNRYLKGEGLAQYKLGLRYSFKKQWYDSLIKFYYSFKTREGYKDGLTGFLLSFFAARYEFLKWKELRKFQKLNS